MKYIPLYFGTGWDEPWWDDLQDWALHEFMDEICPKPIDAPEDIPTGGFSWEEFFKTTYPLTVRRDGNEYNF